MTNINRRHFLQSAGAFLAALGWSQLDIQHQALRYAKVLAQSTPRKLALLIGINNYQTTELSPLKGCETDVELQRELLINRFGFNPKDILTVTGSTQIKPTRAGIIQAVEEHLIKQAKPGDVAVLHFSGHGSRVINPYNPSGDEREKLNSTFVPSDRTKSQAGTEETVSDIMGATLFLWMSATSTENLTVILDSCHSGGGKRGNLTIRAIGGGEQPSAEEKEYHRQWLSKLGLSQEKFIKERNRGVAKGIVIASAAANQYAADAPFDGFDAGAFTYTLTQYLWQQTGNRAAETVLANVSRTTARISSTQQTPEMEAKPASNNQTQPTYFLPAPTPPAEAVIRSAAGKQVEFWLGGIDPQSFAAFNKDSVFAIIDRQGQPQGLIQLESRQGLLARGKVVELKQEQLLQPGALLQEQARAIPSDLKLRIGLDESLGSELNAAREALAKLDRLEPLPLGQTQVEYIFGRMTEAQRQELTKAGVSDSPPAGSLGLYAPGLDLIPGSFGAAGETVAPAIARLKSKFRSLLAARIVKLTLNAESSRLNVAASIKVIGGAETQFAATAFTPRTLTQTDSAPPPISKAIQVVGGIPQLPIGVRVQCEVENREKRDLYVTLLAIDPTGELAVVFPNSWTAGVDAALVKAGETRQIPDPERDAFKLTVGEPVGISEVLVIASLSPLRESLQRLQKIAAGRAIQSGILTLDEESVSAADSFLADIDVRSRNFVVSFDPNTRAARTEQLAALSITYAVSR
ncbi:caspase family protein [Kamptonema formosum]|uniref:caspase family protein n=1 Tax=Kamptonema formosum TaxID=331992 RepID=UPI00034979F0|nr:caspase family protein [Oscillatoria sp. PCC 10802]